MTKMPAGIRPRGDKFLVDVTVNGTRKTATCDTLAEAKDKRDEIKVALRTGKAVKGPRANVSTWTIKQALDKTLSLQKPEGWRGAAYEKQATLNIEDAMSFFGPDKKLDELSRDQINAWLNSCEAKGNSNSTINRKLSSLSKIATVAYENEGLLAPVKFPRQRKEPVGRIRQISNHEEECLLHWLTFAGDKDMAEAVTVLIDTGMRRSELLNLRPSDVDLANGVALIYGIEGKGTKNGGVRSVPMTQRVRDILEQRLSGSTCFSLSESHMRHAWDRARASMRLSEDKDFTLHVCRHTCASRLIQRGVHLTVVQKWLGHSNISTTMRYSHLYPSDLMDAVKVLEG
ncbi:MAG: site-specific integrase [Pseudomonadota bacterium]